MRALPWQRRDDHASATLCGAVAPHNERHRDGARRFRNCSRMRGDIHVFDVTLTCCCASAGRQSILRSTSSADIHSSKLWIERHVCSTSHTAAQRVNELLSTRPLSFLRQKQCFRITADPLRSDLMPRDVLLVGRNRRILIFNRTILLVWFGANVPVREIERPARGIHRKRFNAPRLSAYVPFSSHPVAFSPCNPAISTHS